MLPPILSFFQHGPMGPHGEAMGMGTTLSGWWLLLILVVIGVLVIGAILYVHRQRDADTTDTDSLETLKERYATGEIDETELETRADRLLQQDS